MQQTFLDKPRWWHLFAVATVVVAVYAVVERRYVKEQTRLTLDGADAAMALAKSRLRLAGEISQSGGRLYAGDTTLHDDTAIVDYIKRHTGYGCTIFQGNVRIATTAVAKGGSTRALGTRANQQVTRQVLELGGVFRGVTKTIGKDWVIRYEPLPETSSGTSVGMLATYRELDDFLRELTVFRVYLGSSLVVLFAMVAFGIKSGIRWTRRIESQARELDRHAIRLEEKVLQRTAQLERKTREANDAREVAERANKAKTAFLANMSHELRTPLNAVIGYSELLAEEAVQQGEDQTISDLNRIHTAGEHLLGLISDILDISKIEAGKLELDIEEFDAAAMLQDVVDTAKPLVAKNHNKLVVDVGALPVVTADQVKLRQVLLNLLGNAAKFTERGSIHVSAMTEERQDTLWLVFRVRDSGIGMTADEQARVFDIFAQADISTTRQYGGAGLGLSIAKRFAERMAGELTVESTKRQGTTFTLSVPVGQPRDVGQGTAT